METPPEQRKGSWKVQLLYIAVSFLILTTIILAYNMLEWVSLNRAMQEAEDLGGPITLEQLMAARQKYPDDKNGANVILGIKDRLEALEEAKLLGDLLICCSCDETISLGRRWPADKDKRVREFLFSAQTELAAIDTLMQYEGGRFPLSITPSAIDISQANLKPLRAACRLKRLQVLDRAMKGDTTRLIDDVTLMLLIGDLLVDEPLIVSSLVRIACRSLTIRTVEEVCGLSSIEPGQLLELQNMLGSLDEGTRQMALAARSERAMFIGALDNMRATANWGMRSLLTHDEAEGIRLHNRMVAATEQSRGLEESRVLEKNKPTFSVFSMMTSILFTTYPRAFVLDARTNVQARCAQVAMAVERYRIETGSFPTRLEELVPKYIEKIPADPFKRVQPLKYVVKTDRVIVYSVGVDGNDNGGNVDHEKAVDEEKGDDGFILLFPTARNQPPSPTTTTSSPTE